MNSSVRHKRATALSAGLWLGGVVALGTLTAGCSFIAEGGDRLNRATSKADTARSDAATRDASHRTSTEDPVGKEITPAGYQEIVIDENAKGGQAMSTADTKTADTKTHIPRKVEHADTADFQRKVLESDVPVLVDFYADWCGPCRMLAPALEELARETPNARIVKVDVDRNPELAARYKVGSIPSLAVFSGGEITAQHVGLANKSELKSLLKR